MPGRHEPIKTGPEDHAKELRLTMKEEVKKQQSELDME